MHAPKNSIQPVFRKIWSSLDWSFKQKYERSVTTSCAKLSVPVACSQEFSSVTKHLPVGRWICLFLHALVKKGLFRWSCMWRKNLNFTFDEGYYFRLPSGGNIFFFLLKIGYITSFCFMSWPAPRPNIIKIFGLGAFKVILITINQSQSSVHSNNNRLQIIIISIITYSQLLITIPLSDQ